MICNLEIRADEDNKILAHHAAVDVRWLKYTQPGDQGSLHCAVARRYGLEIARLRTWDDYPIEIRSEDICIEGYMQNADGTHTGAQWILILTDEGWKPGSEKQSYLEEYGQEAILDEVNEHTEYEQDVTGAAMDKIRDAEKVFIQAIDSLGISRELSLAKTNVEQASMWAQKFITQKL